MTFPRYPKYKASGVQWLGEVPEHWQLPKLKSIASFSGGGTPSRDNPSYWNGDIPWVSPKDMKTELLVGSEESITEDGLRSSASNRLPAGHLLIVVRSGILKHTIPVAINDVAVALNQDMKALSFDRQQCSAPFFLRWVQGLNDPLLLAWAKQGATVESIEHSYLADTVIPLPTRAEQDLIAAFLDHETAKIDELVTEQLRLIELLKEKRQAVISHAVTKGLNPDAPMKPSGVEWLGDVPEHWEIQKVKHLATGIEQGWSPQCENYSAENDEEWGVLKVGCVNGGRFTWRENKLLPANEDPQPELALGRGDLLVSRANTRELVGSAAVVDRDYPRLLLCDKLYRIRLRPERASTAFVCRYLGSTAVRGQIELDASGASASMVNIGQSAIMELVIAAPPLAEQLSIESTITNQIAGVEALMNESECAIALLRERRSALISAAVTGQIDVRGITRGVAS